MHAYMCGRGEGEDGGGKFNPFSGVGTSWRGDITPSV